jgi:hypothetical protein
VARLVIVTTANGRARLNRADEAPLRTLGVRRVYTRAAFAGRRPRAGGGEKTMMHDKSFALVEALR